jgi:hypothetical protein
LDDKNDTDRIPYRWANFHLFGNVDPINGSPEIPFSYKSWWWLALGISMLGLVFWKVKK